MSNKICPVCGTNSLESRKETQILKEAYGGQQKVDMTFYHCMACDSEGDFFNENEDKINASIENLKSNEQLTFIINIIIKLVCLRLKELSHYHKEP